MNRKLLGMTSNTYPLFSCWWNFTLALTNMVECFQGKYYQVAPLKAIPPIATGAWSVRLSVVWRPLSREPPRISAKTLYCQKLESLGYIVVTNSIVYLHSSCRGGLWKTHVFWNRVRNCPSRLSKVVDFGTNRKRVCDFLLVINSSLGPILPRFRDIAGFLRRATPLLFHPNFRVVPFGLDWRRCCS